MNNDEKVKKTSKAAKIIIIGYLGVFPFVILVVFGFYLYNRFFTVSYDGSMHSKEEFIKYVDNLDIGKDYKLNLKGKYEIVSDTILKDKENHKYRKMDVKIKSEGFTFSVYSGYICYRWAGGIESKGRCNAKHYELYNNYNIVAHDYYFKKFNDSLGYNENFCGSIAVNCKQLDQRNYIIKNNQDLSELFGYFEKLYSYLKSIKYPFVSYSGSHNVKFDGYKQDLYIAWKFLDNNYALELSLYNLTDGRVSYDNEMIKDINALKDKINNFINYNLIDLK